VIEQQETNEAVGVVSIHTIDPDTGDADVGYWIAPWGRRRAAAVHALYLVEQFALTIPSVKFLSAHIAETNVASRATASRAGFVNMGSTPEPCPDGENLVPALTYVKHLTR
jgi:RimJ/RimL family protein N-acetyltransferase